ncbi:MAG: hypothetical protein DPW16_19890 [Chloroflexi bacterium]|nr:hypothetical protein [Chloroflexota bacterium]
MEKSHIRQLLLESNFQELDAIQSEIIPELIDIFRNDTDEKVRASAINRLIWMRVKADWIPPIENYQRIKIEVPFEVLVEGLKDKSWSVRNASEGLYRVGKDITDDVLKVMTEIDGYMLFQTLHVLASLEDPKAAKPLLQLFQTITELEIKRAITRTLGCIPDNQAIEHILENLDHLDAGMRYDCTIALQSIKDPRAIETLYHLMQMDSKPLKPLHAMTLILTNRKYTDVAVNFLYQELSLAPIDEDTLYYLESILNHLPNEIAFFFVTPLIALTLAEYDETFIRHPAISSLGATKSKVAMHRLIELLADTDQRIVQHAVEELGELGFFEARQALVALLSNEDGKISKAVANSLKKLYLN